MLTFTNARAAVLAAFLASLTFSIGASPQLPLATANLRQVHAGMPNQAPFASEGLTQSNEAIRSGARLMMTPAFPDPLSSTSTYYTVRADRRRCASPLCGGYFVKRVNEFLTRCSDGNYRAECYVAKIDWNGQLQVEPRKALLRGNVIAKDEGRFRKLGWLQVSESWQAASNPGASLAVTPQSGISYRVRDRGVRCITYPCPTHHEAKLNSVVHRNIAGVDLTSAGASGDLVAEASAAMTEADGVLVTGSHAPVSGPGGKSVTLKATQFYLRLKQASASKPCIRTGCSNQICAEEPVVTTCEWRPEYECYKTAKCERQSDGSCGFTKTEQLKSCLARN